MSSTQTLRQFVCERLTQTAQEILGAFETKIESYEEEIARQRRLLDSVLNPKVRLHRADLPHTSLQRQLLDHERNTNIDQQDPGKFKEEQSEISICHKPQQVSRHQDPDSLHLTSSCTNSRQGGQPLEPGRCQRGDRNDAQSEACQSNIGNSTSAERSEQTCLRNSVAEIHVPGEQGGATLVRLELMQNVTVTTPSSPTVHEKHDSNTAVSAASTEQTATTRCTEENPTSGKSKSNSNIEVTQSKRHNEEITTPDENNAPTPAKKPRDGNKSTSNPKTTPTPVTKGNAVKTPARNPTSSQVPKPTNPKHSEGKRSSKGTEVTARTMCVDENTSSRSSEVAPNTPADSAGASMQNQISGEKNVAPTGVTKPTHKTKKHDGKRPSSSAKSRSKEASKSSKKSTGDSRKVSTRHHNSTKEKPNDESSTATKSKRHATLRRHSDGNKTSNGSRVRTAVDNSASALNKESTARGSAKPTPKKKDGTSSHNGSKDSDQPFKCERCGRVLTNFRNYKFHMKSHTVEKTIKCETCGEMFRESWDLKKHVIIHSVKKPFKCKVCKRGFNRIYNLDLHMRVHTGEKPHQCSTCDKRFSSLTNLKKHTRIHTGEKPYSCGECGREFTDSSCFKNHVRLHTGEKPFKCSRCKTTFTTRTALTRHIRTHTGEKPYQCDTCDKRFVFKTALKEHIRMHTGEKPYECPICSARFSTWSKLNYHKASHLSIGKSAS